MFGTRACCAPRTPRHSLPWLVFVNNPRAAVCSWSTPPLLDHPAAPTCKPLAPPTSAGPVAPAGVESKAGDPLRQLGAGPRPKKHGVSGGGVGGAEQQLRPLLLHSTNTRIMTSWGCVCVCVWFRSPATATKLPCFVAQNDWLLLMSPRPPTLTCDCY